MDRSFLSILNLLPSTVVTALCVASMNLIVGYHATRWRHRDGIRKHGLLRSEPSLPQPFGVYIYRDDTEFDHPTYGKERALRCRWGPGNLYAIDRMDIWQVCYCGPMLPDQYVENGMVCLADIPSEFLTLLA